MFIYTGSWGIVITLEKCLHLCWVHGSCVAVIYKIDGSWCDLKQSCAVVATSDTTKRALLVEQKINSSLTAITDMDNATCAAGTWSIFTSCLSLNNPKVFASLSFAFVNLADEQF